MSSKRFVSLDLIKIMLHYASSIGLDTDHICDLSDIGLEALETKEVGLNAHQFERFWEVLVRQSQDDYFGLHFGQTIYRSASGHILYSIMMNSPDIGEAFRKLIRYHSLMTNLAGAKLVEKNDEVLIRTVSAGLLPADLQRHQNDSIFSMFVSGFRQLIQKSDQVTAIQLSHDAPPDTTEYQRVLGLNPSFGQPHNQIHLKKEMLSRPVLLANPDLLHQLEAFAQRQLEQMGQADTFRWAVAEAINTALHRGERPDLVSIAEQLAISPRHLQRKLSEEGTAYREVFNQVQLEIAQTYLQQPDVSICEIAFLLGFSEQSAFNHAFKRWTGLTPGEYRQNQNRARGE